MSYVYRVLENHPVGLWSLDSSGPFPDLSGFSGDTTDTGTIEAAEPIVSGGLSGQLIHPSSQITFPVDKLFIDEYHRNSFSFGVWVKPQSTSGVCWLFNRGGYGLSYSVGIFGGQFSFSVNMAQVITATAYGYDIGDVYYVVATYDTRAISLYINGELAASQSVSDNDLSTGFAVGTGPLSLSTDANSVMVADTVEVYNYSLTEDIASKLYNYGSDYRGAREISTNNGGTPFEFWRGSTDSLVYHEYNFDLEGDFDSGVTSISGTLFNLTDQTTGDYVQGVWRGVFYAPTLSVIAHTSRISWAGTGAVIVETSIDGNTWTAATNGGSPFSEVDLSVDVSLFIRVTLGAGVESSLSTLSVTLYDSKAILANDGQSKVTQVSLAAASIQDNYTEPMKNADDSGITLASGGGLVVSPGIDTITSVNSVELVARFDALLPNVTLYSDGTASVTTDASGNFVYSGLTLYVDGASVASGASISAGVWHRIVAVLSAATSGPLYIANNSAGNSSLPMTISHLAIYDAALSANVVSLINNAWTGATPSVVIDSSTVSVSELTNVDTSTAYKAYTYDWSAA